MLSIKEKLMLLGILHYAVAIALIIIKFAPFNVDLSDTVISEQTYTLLLADSIIMGSIFYALSGPLQKSSS
jgi:hypothetical protein